MNTSKSEYPIGRLEIICYVAALLLGIGSIVGAWTFNMVIALILLAAVYGVLREVRALSRLNAENQSARPSEQMIPLQRPWQKARSPQPFPEPPAVQSFSGPGPYGRGELSPSPYTIHNAERDDA